MKSNKEIYLGKFNEKYKENPVNSIATVFLVESVSDWMTVNSLFQIVMEDKL